MSAPVPEVRTGWDLELYRAGAEVRQAKRLGADLNALGRLQPRTVVAGCNDQYVNKQDSRTNSF